MEQEIPLIDIQAHRRRIGAKIDARLAAVVDHGRYIMGPEVAEFEAAVQDYIGVDGVHAVSCGNGTDALVLAFQALGLRSGSAVICPAFTFVATAEAVATLGAVPVFADVEPDGFNLSPESVREAAKAAEKAGLYVEGVCAVDLFGEPADYEALSIAAEELGCWLVADSAQSFGGRQNGTTVGALAAVTTTSFFPAKPLGCYGDGGMVMTGDAEVAELLRSLRVHGKGDYKYDNVRIGQNSRLDTLQAAVLLPKLEILDDEIDARDRVARRYSESLAEFVGTPAVAHGSRSAWAQYTIVTEHRERLQSALSDAGIGHAVYYPKPLHHQSGYKQYHIQGIDLERSEMLASRVLSLPMYPYLEEDAIDRVVTAVRSCPQGS